MRKALLAVQLCYNERYMRAGATSIISRNEPVYLYNIVVLMIYTSANRCNECTVAIFDKRDASDRQTRTGSSRTCWAATTTLRVSHYMTGAALLPVINIVLKTLVLSNIGTPWMIGRNYISFGHIWVFRRPGFKPMLVLRNLLLFNDHGRIL